MNNLAKIQPPTPGELRTEDEIIGNWKGWKPGDPVKLSIRCATYNHEKYIQDAICGFLIQRTDFPFEILIHDDASSDKTAAVIRRFEGQYPNIIRAIYQKENLFSRGIKPGSILAPLVRGQYIAACEGDDYWTDPQKLQTQVEFLDANPDYVVSGHDAFVIDRSGSLLKDSKLKNRYKKDFLANELAMGKGWLLTMSLVYRNVIKEYAYEGRMVKNGDTFLLSMLGSHGKSHFHDDIAPAAYRVHQGGIWSSVSKEKRKLDSMNTWFWIFRYHDRVGNDEYARCFLERFQSYAIKEVPISRLIVQIFLRIVTFRSVRQMLRH